MPSGAIVNINTHTSNNPADTNDGEEMIMETDEQPASVSVISPDDWHEAAYVLNIKEQYILSQVAVDQVISCTKTLVSDVLNTIMDDIQDSIPSTVQQLLEDKISIINNTIFKRLTSATLQKNYFKKYFNLVVSNGNWGGG